jgi:hypothetical protein
MGVLYFFSLTEYNIRLQSDDVVLYPRKEKKNDRAEIRTTFLLTPYTTYMHTNKMTEKTNSEPFIIALYLYVALSLSLAYNQEKKREKEKKKK